jgi:hypothetical protein
MAFVPYGFGFELVQVHVEATRRCQKSRYAYSWCRKEGRGKCHAAPALRGARPVVRLRPANRNRTAANRNRTRNEPVTELATSPSRTEPPRSYKAPIGTIQGMPVLGRFCVFLRLLSLVSDELVLKSPSAACRFPWLLNLYAFLMRAACDLD